MWRGAGEPRAEHEPNEDEQGGSDDRGSWYWTRFKLPPEFERRHVGHTAGQVARGEVADLQFAPLDHREEVGRVAPKAAVRARAIHRLQKVPPLIEFRRAIGMREDAAAVVREILRWLSTFSGSR